jgi:hypothetical protein
VRIQGKSILNLKNISPRRHEEHEEHEEKQKITSGLFSALQVRIASLAGT